VHRLNLIVSNFVLVFAPLFQVVAHLLEVFLVAVMDVIDQIVVLYVMQVVA
jgi:hypothetical protein